MDSGESTADTRTAASGHRASQLPRELLLEAEMATIPVLRFFFRKPCLGRQLAGPPKDFLVFPRREIMDRDSWKVEYDQPEASLSPFHDVLRGALDLDERLQRISDLLAFLARVELQKIPALVLRPDAIWCNREHPDDFVLLVGPTTNASWGASAACLIAESWSRMYRAGTDSLSTDSLLDWMQVLLVAQPPLPHAALGLLRDAIIDQQSTEWLLQRWQAYVKGTPQAVEAVVPFRFGAHQVVGHRKGSDLDLPQLQQEDRYHCRLVAVGDDAGDASSALLALADGVSRRSYGHGAEAAERAITVVREHPGRSPSDVGAYLRELFRAASAAVREYAASAWQARLGIDHGAEIPPAAGPCTTLTVAVVEPWGQVHVGWTGDSPCYRWVSALGTLVPLTYPHSVQFELLTEGSPLESTRGREDGASLTRCLGGADDTMAYAQTRLAPGDAVLICSDGLIQGFHHDASEARALRTLSTFMSVSLIGKPRIQRLIERMCAEADTQSGQDNISVAAVWVGEPEQLSESALSAASVSHAASEVNPVHEPSSVRPPDAARGYRDAGKRGTPEKYPDRRR